MPLDDVGAFMSPNDQSLRKIIAKEPRVQRGCVMPTMSALGQKRTCAVQLGDVRFVPIADITGLFDHLVSHGKQRTGMVRPSALAVLRLRNKFILGRACTGMSAGFSPLRMRST